MSMAAEVKAGSGYRLYSSASELCGNMLSGASAIAVMAERGEAGLAVDRRGRSLVSSAEEPNGEAQGRSGVFSYRSGEISLSVVSYLI